MTKLTNFFTRYEGCFPTRRGRRLQAAVIAGILVGLLGLVACAGQPATQTARPTSTPELLTEEPSTATALLAPTPTPEPLPTGTTARAPDHVRLDLDDGIVVAFAADSSRGRIAYVTHVPSGAQAVLDAEGAVIERHGSPGGDGGLLDVVLEDVNAMARIQEGLRYKGSLLRNPIVDWLDVIRFSGIEYHRSSHPHSGASDGEQQLDRSHLGTVLYRVAFSLDANLVPVGYRPQDGDAAYLGPGTAIHRVQGYDPSQRLAAVVDGEVLLYDRSGPTSLNGAATHRTTCYPGAMIWNLLPGAGECRPRPRRDLPPMEPMISQEMYSAVQLLPLQTLPGRGGRQEQRRGRVNPTTRLISGRLAHLKDRCSTRTMTIVG